MLLDHPDQAPAGRDGAPVVSLRIAHAAQGETFAQLFEQNVERVYRYALARTGNVDEAQDLTAEVFHAALKTYDQYQTGRGSQLAWLMGIARHKWVDHLRRDRHAIPIEDLEGCPDTGPCPEELATRRLQLVQISAALKQLPPARAEAVALVFFGGLSLAETGAAMGKNIEAVKKLVGRGLADLQRELASKQELIP